MRSITSSELSLVAGGQDFPTTLPTRGPAPLTRYPEGSIGHRATNLCEGLPDSTNISFEHSGGASFGLNEPIQANVNQNTGVTVEVDCGDIRSAQPPKP